MSQRIGLSVTSLLPKKRRPRHEAAGSAAAGALAACTVLVLDWLEASQAFWGRGSVGKARRTGKAVGEGADLFPSPPGHLPDASSLLGP